MKINLPNFYLLGVLSILLLCSCGAAATPPAITRTAGAASINAEYPTPAPIPPTATPIPSCVFNAVNQAQPNSSISLDSLSFSEPRVLFTNTIPVALSGFFSQTNLLLTYNRIGIGTGIFRIADPLTKSVAILKKIENFPSARTIIPIQNLNKIVFSFEDVAIRKYRLGVLDLSTLQISQADLKLQDPYFELWPDGTDATLFAAGETGEAILYNLKSNTVREIKPSWPPVIAYYDQGHTGYPERLFYKIAARPRTNEIIFHDSKRLFLNNLSNTSFCEINLGDIGQATILYAKWSGDGQYLAIYILPNSFYGAPPYLIVYDANTGNKNFYFFSNRGIENIEWFPGSHLILATIQKSAERTDGNYNILTVLDAETHQVREMLPNNVFFAGGYWGTPISSDERYIAISCPAMTKFEEYSEWRVCIIEVTK